MNGATRGASATRLKGKNDDVGKHHLTSLLEKGPEVASTNGFFNVYEAQDPRSGMEHNYRTNALLFNPHDTIPTSAAAAKGNLTIHSSSAAGFLSRLATIEEQGVYENGERPSFIFTVIMYCIWTPVWFVSLSCHSLYIFPKLIINLGDLLINRPLQAVVSAVLQYLSTRSSSSALLRADHSPDDILRLRFHKAHLFNAIETVPCVTTKADWALRWIEIGIFLVAFVQYSG